jgi:hypothetical protein
MTTRHLRTVLTTTLVFASASLVGCGNDDVATKPAASADNAACAAQAALEQQQFGENPSAEQLRTVGAAGVTALEQLTGVDGASAAADRMLSAYRQLADAGDPSALNEDVFAAKADLAAWAAASCGRPSLVFVATDHAYEPSPTSITAGLTTIEIDNRGAVDHEVQIARLRDPKARFTADQISAGDPAFLEGIDYLGVAYSSPGKKGWTVMDLQPGTYVAFCIIPVGMPDTTGQPEAIDAGATTHAQAGMMTMFEVAP